MVTWTPSPASGSAQRGPEAEQGVGAPGGEGVALGVDDRVAAVAQDPEGADERAPRALAAERLDREAPEVGDDPDRGPGAAALSAAWPAG